MDSNLDEYVEFLERPATANKILNGYRGPLSLGIGFDPENKEHPCLAILLGVPKTDHVFPEFIEFNETILPIRVDRNWEQAIPFKGAKDV